MKKVIDRDLVREKGDGESKEEMETGRRESKMSRQFVYVCEIASARKRLREVDRGK